MKITHAFSNIIKETLNKTPCIEYFCISIEEAVPSMIIQIIHSFKNPLPLFRFTPLYHTHTPTATPFCNFKKKKPRQSITPFWCCTLPGGIIFIHTVLNNNSFSCGCFSISFLASSMASILFSSSAASSRPR